ncbi:MAG: hypothetical protein ACREP9_15190, partial [Candidatus Dormibacteraceae bacterium]
MLVEQETSISRMYETTISHIDHSGRLEALPGLQSIPLATDPVVSEGGTLAFVSHGPRDKMYEWFKPQVPYVISEVGGAPKPVGSIGARAIDHLWWDGERVLWAQTFVPGTGGELVAADWQSDKVVHRILWPEGSLSKCTLSTPAGKGVCIAETLTEPPKPVVISLQTGAFQQLPFLRFEEPLRGVKFRTLNIVNRYGISSTAFLALPQNVDRKGGVPLAVILLGASRRFSRIAQDIPNYPVEEVLKSGIAVLLLGFQERPFEDGDATGARFEFLDSKLATIEAALQTPA